MTFIYCKDDVKIRSSVERDVEDLRDCLREVDRAELQAFNGQTPYQALSYGRRHSTFCATVLFKDKPVAMFGVVPDSKVKTAAAVWLLASDGIYLMRYSFLRLSRRYVKLMQARYPLLWNFIDPKNTATIRWLLWCGASLDDPKPVGKDGAMFQYFTLEKSMKAVA